jgi:hypothetical protein
MLPSMREMARPGRLDDIANRVGIAEGNPFGYMGDDASSPVPSSMTLTKFRRPAHSLKACEELFQSNSGI